MRGRRDSDVVAGRAKTLGKSIQANDDYSAKLRSKSRASSSASRSSTRLDGFNIIQDQVQLFTMALVDYPSDSEDTGPDSAPVPVPASTKPPTALTTDSKRIVDRGNPRKILVNLADAKPDGVENDEPARKRPRIGAGGAFSGFNAMLPAPKRAKMPPSNNNAESVKDTTRKVFSLKTSAAPGFERPTETNAHQEDKGEEQSDVAPKKTEDVKIKGNAMMFKPLSVARGTTKKKAKAASATPLVKSTMAAVENTTAQGPETRPLPKPKSKRSLFGLSSEQDSAPSVAPSGQLTVYEPLVYNTEPAPGPSAPPVDAQQDISSSPQRPAGQSGAQNLESIASDLNLSKSQMRQLLGRRGQEAPGSKILTFDTEQEYKANAEYLATASDAELAAMQHNPVRSIAPGKHSLQQLVNAVSNQRDALEESFAAGRRNRKEAGSKYGW